MVRLYQQHPFTWTWSVVMAGLATVYEAAQGLLT